MNTETGKLKKIIGSWENDIKYRGSEMTPETAIKFEAEFNDIISQIDHLKDSEKAFGYLIAVVYIMNEAIKKNPALLDKLLEWIKKLKEKLEAIADNLKANNYSISVGYPLGISVGISFSPK